MVSMRLGSPSRKSQASLQAATISRLVPTGTVAHHDGMRAKRNLCADLFEVFRHCFGIDARHDDRGADLARMADGAEQICRVMAVVAHHGWTRTDRCPNVFQAAFLADPCFVLT